MVQQTNQIPKTEAAPPKLTPDKLLNQYGQLFVRTWEQVNPEQAAQWEADGTMNGRAYQAQESILDVISEMVENGALTSEAEEIALPMYLPLTTM